ncbi:MAG: hypothetical protein AB7E32_11510 [Desulfovibrio sp.]
MARTNPLLHSLPLLASALGRSYGIQVHIGGNRAWTDGRVIHLPSLPAEADRTFLGLVRGYVDHEAAHLRYTDFDCLRDLTALEKHIWNIFEDWRVENLLAAQYPGCRRNFTWLIRHLFLERSPEPDEQNPALLLLNWLLLSVRSWDVPELSVRVRKARDILDRFWPDLLVRVGMILEQVRRSCPDSQACLDAARAVVRELGHKAKALPAAEPQAASVERLLGATEKELPGELGAILGKSLELGVQGKDERAGARVQVATIGGKSMRPLMAEQLETARRITLALRTRLQGKLQAQLVCHNVPSSRGRVAPTRLHRLAVRDAKVFLRQGQRTAMNTAVHLLLDCSGSMRRRITVAGQVCHVLARTMELMGINVAVTVFPAGHGEDDLQTVAPLVRHGQPVHTRFGLAASGKTPMGEALWWAILEMVPLREQRKILLLVTDGDPDNHETAKQALSAARLAEIEVFGLGIDSPGITSLMPRRSINIQAIRELAPAMFQLFAQALFHSTNS